eukprot:5355540-Alexandrium_andersonii.AAC.1
MSASLVGSEMCIRDSCAGLLRRVAPCCARLRRVAPDCAGLRLVAPRCAGLRRFAAPGCA